MEKHEDQKAESSREEVKKPETTEQASLPSKSNLQDSDAASETSNKAQEEIAKMIGADISFKFENGMAYVQFFHEGSDAGASASVWVKADNLIDKLAAAIPGKWDDVAFAALKGAIRNIKTEPTV